MVPPLLLCTDLDRTVLPNGSQPESPEARPFFRKLAAKAGVTLVYVSGRDQKLILDAIAEFELPQPRYAVCDVGTTIYEINGNRWQVWDSWHEEIQADWQGKNRQDLSDLLADLDFLELQEPEKQKTFKLSYYTRAVFDLEKGLARVRGRLEQAGIRASLVWSVDQPAQRGLLDILPGSADKLHALTFLMRRKGFDDRLTVFAGDSGNDMAVLTSGLKAILVGNAGREVRDEALRYLAATDQLEQLYIARGDFLGMNGNYAAGVVEGVGHFFPEILADIS